MTLETSDEHEIDSTDLAKKADVIESLTVIHKAVLRLVPEAELLPIHSRPDRSGPDLGGVWRPRQ